MKITNSSMAILSSILLVFGSMLISELIFGCGILLLIAGVCVIYQMNEINNIELGDNE